MLAGGYHRPLGFNTWKSAGGAPQPDGVAGLRHAALNFSSQAELAETLGRLVDAGVPLRQLTDHGTHLAVYLSDPDGNNLELAWDRSPDELRRYGWDDAPPNDGRFELDDLSASSAAPNEESQLTRGFQEKVHIGDSNLWRPCPRATCR